jgi:hypothetical protein
MKFALSVASLFGFAILAVTFEIGGSKWLGSAIGMGAFEGTLALAACIFIASQWHFLRKFNPGNTRALDYAANLLGVVSCIIAFYGFTADTTHRLYLRYRDTSKLAVTGATAAASAYNEKFCIGNGITVPKSAETSITCDLTQKTQRLLDNSFGVSAESVARLITQEIVPNDLGGQLKSARRWDLEAFISKHGPIEIAQFNVIYSYLDSISDLTKRAEQYQRAFERLRWARFLGTDNGRQLMLWVAFNAIVMKLGVVLLASRRRPDDGSRA